ncbi:hypothetical protein XAC3810_770028 [Xanthomonas citri pv. citri]|uniref:Uncharacterized protein n=1 Tax=Xanthomonas citri pv. citri TaxID=611301 RepID=A0A0U5FR50_XANCI|nr:hypothetical protein XAC902_1070028 [Xanthomonas citri pv. citri]CEE22499.1 hypothetical protein XAC908_1080001 [Xanthomonas citri pv. citri]CEE39664.1 hypothetical protein XAC9322_740028 [Xanthomonas citri pv. citri]CEE39706.1 hypothetical protein XAC3824_920028 [Xanthomonas citri pv. citri]CEE40916.1 hypothetical protein XAC1083_760028 [Xanthomonas citri pv. citri]
MSRRTKRLRFALRHALQSDRLHSRACVLHADDSQATIAWSRALIEADALKAYFLS